MARPARVHGGEVLAIRHVQFEHLGTFEDALARRGYHVRYAEAGADDLATIDPLSPRLLVVLGGPIGAYEEALYPFLLDELRLVERRLAAGRPILGICLGCQLIARALGARVYPGSAKEIGWSPLTLTESGGASPLAHLAGCDYRVLHWHGDTFDLPAGVELLASTTATAHQAFRRGADTLALQFHIEIDPGQIERWLVGHACEIAGVPGLDARTLRADTARFGPPLAACAGRMLDDWLDKAGL
jgi:GMP synthase (glutamine-hydrolysing)